MFLCRTLLLSARTAVAVVCCSLSVPAQEWKSGVEWQEPPTVTPGASNDARPSDATVLFDGSSLDAWEGGEKWLVEDGVAIPRQSEIRTKQHFGDIQLHVEWSAPTEIRGAGQGRGNSGIFLMGLYEVQVLDSYDNETYFDGQAGSIYKQTPPLAKAMRKPGEWNHYDVIFNGPRFRSNGDLERPGYVTLIQNGVLLLNHFELQGPTSYVEAPHYTAHAETGPIALQFHGDPVKFRNIWVREIKPATGRRTAAPFNIEPKQPKARKPEVVEPAKDQPAKDQPARNEPAKNEADNPAKDRPVTDKPVTDKPDAESK